MVDIQEAVIDESIVLTTNQVQLTSLAPQTQVRRAFAPSSDSEHSERILCCYINNTNLLQIARSANISNWWFERVVFPGKRLLFEALPDAQLEIHTGMMATAILTDKIPCAHIRISD